MKNNIFKNLLILIIWTILAYILFSKGLITSDYNKLLTFINLHKKHAILFFIILSVLRICVFIPGTVFMILSGILFNPITAFLLSMTAMIIDQTIIYLLANIFSNSKLQSKFTNKYPYIVPLLKQYGYKFLSIGIICPISPTDVVCFLSASLKLNYFKYILVVIISNTPLILLYSFIGNSFNHSIYVLILMITCVILISIYTIQMWNKLKHCKNNTFVNN
ncbi:TVP38/TMEM64 family protein [Clostridium ganghwense]|uniref:TVP38/TMEM64 family membrane protein n=1 Tax=Clostridium ganghwense TaxID=312089 RepID=A0ABT4CKC9_9CLOT|nr:VTT domain-containing protein [Clostridium ganghwense]MCY6369505.1 VTT domain-containing protein [Clostridium ganghwense]